MDTITPCKRPLDKEAIGMQIKTNNSFDIDNDTVKQIIDTLSSYWFCIPCKCAFDQWTLFQLLKKELSTRYHDDTENTTGNITLLITDILQREGYIPSVDKALYEFIGNNLSL